MWMTRARNTSLPLFRALSILGLVATWAVACGGPPKLGDEGTVCFRPDDCRPGLACVPGAKGSTRLVCSANLEWIVSMVDGGPPEPEATSGAGGAPASGSTGVSGGPASGGGAGDLETAGA